jgi:hypothetical protein
VPAAVDIVQVGGAWYGVGARIHEALNTGDASILAGDFLHTTPVAKNGSCFWVTKGTAEAVGVLCAYIGDMTAVLRWEVAVECWDGSTYFALRAADLVGDADNIAFLGVQTGFTLVCFCPQTCCRFGEGVIARCGDIDAPA